MDEAPPLPTVANRKAADDYVDEEKLANLLEGVIKDEGLVRRGDLLETKETLQAHDKRMQDVEKTISKDGWSSQKHRVFRQR